MKNKYMTKKILKAVTVLSALSISSSAVAMPSAYVSKYGSLFIQNSTNSTLLRDTEKSQTVWVLPPSAGKTEFKGIVPSANLGFCPGISNLMKASNDIDVRIGRIAEKKMELEPELKEAEEELRQALADRGEVAEDPIIKDMLLLQNQIVALETRQMDLIESLDACTESCELIIEEFNEVSDHLREQRKFLRTVQRDNRDATQKLRLADSKVAAAEASFDSVGKRYETLVLKLAKLSNQVMEMYAAKGKLEGGTALVDYDTKWEQNVSQLEAEYGQYDFKAIPTANARINANIVGSSDQASYIQSLPAVLDYTINGTKYVSWGKIDHTDSALPSVIAGNIRLSTLGACPIAVADFFKDTGFEPVRGSLSTPMYAISATYDYPVAYKFDVKASYNLYKFYEIIKEQGTSGGFFSSSSYSKTVEKKIDKDAFNIDWKVEDPDSKYDAEMRIKITAEIKKDLMNRVLNTMAVPAIRGESQATFADPGVPPEPGSIVIAKGLQQTCGWNIYCQAGGWVLRGLQAVFGSSKVEQSFKATWDRTATESWSHEVAKYRPAITSFKR